MNSLRRQSLLATPKDPYSVGCKRLVVGGVWQVPVEERPVNWRELGAKEPPARTDQHDDKLSS